jgi:hypothetical protein
MRCGYNDLYVLAPHRTEEAVRQFLDAVLPNREATADEYEFPEYSNLPEQVFREPAAAIRYAVAHRDERKRIGFHNAGDGEPAHAMVFFTGDGGMILGVSLAARQDEREREAAEIAGWLARLCSLTGARWGYALHESPPSYETIETFLKDSGAASDPKIVDGVIWRPAPGESSGPVMLLRP